MSGRGFVDYSENGEHTDRHTHKGSYRVRPGLKLSDVVVMTKTNLNYTGILI